MLEFLNWPIVGSGSERICYRDPYNPLRCIKVSKKTQSKQTRRELKYYKYLEKRKISYLHIPKFYRQIDEDELIGLEVEFICQQNGERAPDLHEYFKKPLTEHEITNFYKALEKLKRYLVTNNIIPCDLVLSNFLVLTTPEGIKITLVDGLGGAELFPISNYFPVLGRRKIERKWKKFLLERIEPAIEASRAIKNSH